MSGDRRPPLTTHHSFLITRYSTDPRLTDYVELLPRYGALLQRLDLGARSAARPGAGPEQCVPELATACLYLGIKLCESKGYLDAIARGCRVLGQRPPGHPSYPGRWARLSAQVDSFVFAAYGALDALAQLVVTAYAVKTAEEVKFPALVRILSAAGADYPHDPLRAQLTAIYEAEWFRDLRRLRNLVNYRSIIPAARSLQHRGRREPAEAAEPALALAAAWTDPPSPLLPRLAALPAYCASVQGHVVQTVEGIVDALEGAAVLAPLASRSEETRPSRHAR